MSELCNADDPVALARSPEAPPHRRAGADPRQQPLGPARPGAALAAGAGRPAGGQGRRRHLRPQHARAGGRGAGQGRSGAGRRHPRADRGGGRRRSARRAARAREAADAAQGASRRPGRLVAISRGRDRSGRRDLHQVPAHVGGRPRQPRSASIRVSRWNNPEPELVLVVERRRPDRRRHARQRRQSARRRGAQRAASRQGQGQQRLLQPGAVHPAGRRGLRARRHARAPRSR